MTLESITKEYARIKVFRQAFSKKLLGEFGIFQDCADTFGEDYWVEKSSQYVEQHKPNPNDNQRDKDMKRLFILESFLDSRCVDGTINEKAMFLLIHDYYLLMAAKKLAKDLNGARPRFDQLFDIEINSILDTRWEHSGLYFKSDEEFEEFLVKGKIKINSSKDAFYKEKVSVYNSVYDVFVKGKLE